MSEDTKLTKRPSHIAYQVRDTDDGKAYFNRVGSAFEHKDGEGFNVILDSVPVDGRVTLRTPSQRVQELKEDRGERGVRGARGRRAEYERD